MKRILAMALAATMLAGCATSGIPLTPEESAARAAAFHQYNIDRVRAAMALGIINIEASPTQIFWADTLCGALVLAATMSDGTVLDSPVEVAQFCDDISALLIATIPAATD